MIHTVEQKEVHTLVLEQDYELDPRVNKAVDWLAAQSRETVLLRPGLMVPYNDMPTVPGLQRWPAWQSQPWIVAGRIARRTDTPEYDGPFIKDTYGEGYEAQVAKLMAHFDWAVFSYFTTYHDDMVSVVTHDSKLAKVIERQYAPFASYRSSAPYLHCLRNMSFYDYGDEGWLAYELAKARGEPSPLILTMAIDEKYIDQYRRYDDDGEYEDDVWFEQPMSRLKLVKEFKEDGVTYARLHQATDFEAYIALWAESSRNWYIADATFSADCDLYQLEKRLRRNNDVDILRDSGEIATWAYGQIYGGGADEHHAVFHSRDPRATQRIWEMAGKSGISRF